MSATGRPFTLLDALEPGDGSSVGNRFAALPPGLRVGLVVVTEETPGRLPTGSGDVVVIGDVVGLGVADVEVDADGDGLPDVNALGQFVTSTNQPAPSPFFAGPFG